MDFIIEKMPKYACLKVIKKEMRCSKCKILEVWETQEERQKILDNHIICDTDNSCIKTWICECGSKGKRGYSTHIKSEKHLGFVKSQET